jgi:prepilin-type N-terminal cleavage/methylation domain-containing protein
VTAPNRHGLDDHGFTLIELLVALIISGILVAAVFQVIGGQARFSEMQSGREEVQQNARASVELISSELRSTPPGGFTIEDEGKMISFALPSVWGTLCSYEPGERWSRVLLPDVPHSSIEIGRTRLGLHAEDMGGYSATISNRARRDQLGSCADLIDGASDSEMPAGYQVWRIQTETAVPEDFREGAPSVHLFEQIEYRAAVSAGVAGVWLSRKRGADGTREPLAGPLHEAEEGFLVEALQDPTGRVIGLHLRVAMESRHQGGVQQVDSSSTTIYFRHEGE